MLKYVDDVVESRIQFLFALFGSEFVHRHFFSFCTFCSFVIPDFDLVCWISFHRGHLNYCAAFLRGPTFDDGEREPFCLFFIKRKWS